MLTRKDYVAIAKAIHNATPGNTDSCGSSSARAAACSDIAYQLIDHFAADNPRFDRARFLKACGVHS